MLKHLYTPALSLDAVVSRASVTVVVHLLFYVLTETRVVSQHTHWPSVLFQLMEHYKGWCHPVPLTRKCRYYAVISYLLSILLETTKSLCQITSSM